MLSRDQTSHRSLSNSRVTLPFSHARWREAGGRNFIHKENCHEKITTDQQGDD